MYYIVYKTTNLLNGMIYVGSHQTNNLNDNYLGSGKHLRRAIKKYGRENFKFEILHIHPSKEEMFEAEKNIVNEDFVKDPLTYNLKIGGSGGNPGIVGAFKGRTHSEETKEKQRQASANQITTDEKRKKISVNNGMKQKDIAEKVSKSLMGRTCSEEHRRRVAEANLGKTIVNNGVISKRIPKEELSAYQSIGWTKGILPKK